MDVSRAGTERAACGVMAGVIGKVAVAREAEGRGGQGLRMRDRQRPGERQTAQQIAERKHP